MADPFSIVCGSLSIVDVCVRVCNFLRNVATTAKNLNKEIGALQGDIDGFRKVFESLKRLCESSGHGEKHAAVVEREDPCDALWARSKALILRGHEQITKLDALLSEVVGKDNTDSRSKLEEWWKSAKLLSKDNEYTAIRNALEKVNRELNTIFTAIELISNDAFRSTTSASLEKLPSKITKEIQTLGVQLKSQISALQDSREGISNRTLSPAKAAVAFASLNHHFYVQTPDTSTWTGRSRHLETVKAAFLAPEPPGGDRKQRRFVIHGIAGAGKTQFCCKFAQDYRESFWGIYWVDGSTPQNAEESWKRIAKLGKQDANAEAGKDWLSNLQSPWLLIVDGADDNVDSIQAHFPGGDRGCILITTRNPRMRLNATVGNIHLDRLDETEANDLLRKLTQHEPWDASAIASASSISHRLGYLPLALIHAGRAIFHRLCTLQGYIRFFDQSLKNYRLSRASQILHEEETFGKGALTTFDIIYSGLEAKASSADPSARVYQDAIELVNVFSLFHSSDICLETIIRAGYNQERTEDGSRYGRLPAAEPSETPKSLVQQLKDVLMAWVVGLHEYEPALPSMFRKSAGWHFDECRARRALDTLVRMAMVSESSEHGCYSMHPLVHLWVRKRLGLAEQALWGQIAENVLASSIRLQTRGADEFGDIEYHNRILLHIQGVRAIQKDIKQQLSPVRPGARSNSLTSWLRLSRPPAATITDASNHARYSRLYMECGRYAEAESAQRVTLDFLVSNLGRRHPLSIRFHRGLAGSLWHQGKSVEASKILEHALAVSIAARGEKDVQALRIMDLLGETRWQQGRLVEAKEVLEAAINGMDGNPALAVERLKAIDHLGRVHRSSFNLDAARKLHLEALDGLASLRGRADVDTLIAMDNLAMTLVQHGTAKDAALADALMQQVFDARRATLAKEHVYMLWATCDLARARAARAALEHDLPRLLAARAALEDGLALARRCLGPAHPGTLFGRMHLAAVRALLGDLPAAEADLRDVLAVQARAPPVSGVQPDRLGVRWALVRCLQAQGRVREAAAVCARICAEVGAFGGPGHPVAVAAARKKAELEAGAGGGSGPLGCEGAVLVDV